MKRFKITAPLIALLVAMVVVTAIRVRLLSTPLERDEGEFAYAGQLMLQGIPPYKLFYNMKFPGIYAAYAVILGIFGQTPEAIHLGLLLINLANTCFVYLLARKFLSAWGSSAAAASFVLLAATPGVLGTSAHATHFVILFALTGLLVFLIANDTKKSSGFFWSGVLFALACLMKQPGAMFGFFAAVTLAVKAIKVGQRAASLRELAWLAFGGAAPLLLTGLILWWCGVFPKFWFWTVTYARIHGDTLGWKIAATSLKDYFRIAATRGNAFYWMYWLVAGSGVSCLIFIQMERAKKLWLVGFALFSFAAVSMGFFYSSHYFVMLLPALALFIGVAVDACAHKEIQFGMLTGLALLWAATVYSYREIFFQLSPAEACRKLYASHPFLEAQKIGEFLKDNSPPDATIAVLGSEPEVFFYAHRHSASPYIYMYDFVAPQPYAQAMQEEMIQQLTAARPDYFIFFKWPYSWDLLRDFSRSGHIEIMEWMPKFVANDYTGFGLAEYAGTDKYFWGPDAFKRPRPRNYFISILKRK